MSVGVYFRFCILPGVYQLMKNGLATLQLWKPPPIFLIHPYPVCFSRHWFFSVNRKSPLITLQTITERTEPMTYLSHCVVLHGNFPEEEVDEVAIIDRLNKVWLCGWTKWNKMWNKIGALSWRNNFDTTFHSKHSTISAVLCRKALTVSLECLNTSSIISAKQFACK